MEEQIDEKEFGCSNDGQGTNININSGEKSALDLTLVSRSAAEICNWDVWG